MAEHRWSPAELLPHGTPMVLLDEILEKRADGLDAALTVASGSPLFEAGRGVPAHLGIEWMAQACGAFAGVEAREAGDPVRLGFLLGTRRYQADRQWFGEGERLVIRVRLVFREDGMGVFDCRILDGDRQCASAQLTVYQPEDAAAVLAQRPMGEQA